MSYLEDYIEKISTLPIDINRNLRLLRHLDRHNQAYSVELETKQSTYLNHLKNAKDKRLESMKPDNQALHDEIKKLQRDCLSLAKEKIDISQQNYELVDSYIQKLDQELRRFEDEIKGQTEQLQGIQEELTKDPNKRSGKYTGKFKGKNAIKPSEKHLLQTTLAKNDTILDPAHLPVDKNEPTYCYCNGISYGDMISCDNPFCEKEWFHFGCTGLTTKPKGKWYCDDCKALRKKYGLLM